VSKFRLDRIIEVKEKHIEDKEAELELTVSNLRSLINDIAVIEQDIEKTYNEMVTPSIKGNDFSVLKDYLAYLENRRLAMLEEKEHIEEQISLLKSELVELLKELKMLETLRTKSFKALKKSENRKEQKNLDAMALRLGERRL
jgi:flagellar export protein FliJ